MQPERKYFLRPGEIFAIIVQHHERMDGSGYPYGLKGDEISEEGRLLAICDSYDAMVTDRVYKRGKAHEEAIQELRDLSGSLFDARLVEEFIAMMAKWNQEKIPTELDSD